MRMAIIRVPQDADVPWLWDRLAWAQSPRVLLVLPRQGVPRLVGPLPWVQIAHRARSLGTQVGVVTRQPLLARWISDAGVPVFPSVDAAQTRPWRGPRRRRLRKRLPRGREALVQRKDQLGLGVPAKRESRPWQRGISLLLTSAALFLLAGFFLPQARVEVPLAGQVQERSVRVLLSPDFYGPVPSVRGLPLVPMAVEVEGWRVVSASGTVDVPTHPAQVSLLWTSLTNQEVTLPAGLRVRDVEGQMDFVLLKEGVLPPGPGMALLLPAQAVRPGKEGNLPPHRLRLVEPPWDSWVMVTNPAAASGGDSKTFPALTQEDRDQALAFLEQTLIRKAQALAPLQLPPGAVMVPNSLRPSGLLEAHMQPPVGTPASSGVLYVRQRFRAWVVPSEAIASLVRVLLEEFREPGRRVWPGSLDTHLTVEPAEGPPYVGTLTLRWLEVPNVEPRRIAWALSARPVAWLQRQDSGWLGLAGSPEVSLEPQGWPWLPAGFRIQVILRPGQGEP